ncbi:nuclear transport factor 2 family protein [Aliifodinibius halophilus]|uniref:Nuclear transport factor 2 family protein n=2 Tax=Fodinibius halophilus TaxID=1736908 RepID=A0A6M1TFP4_9BACT|nr:nuclear transport factor 2 family protein [Fodinibius halophilus]
MDTAPATEKAVNRVLDDWHAAAADADFERYFNHFASDSAIFMGTDATERWTVAEFRPWSKPYFDRGKAWSFTPVERHLYFSENGTTAWFDEALDTPNLGPARGTGVLISKGGEWKIAHYNLSIPIPNAIADTVIKQVEQALQDTTAQ